MVPELRARGIGEILDAAVALYRECFTRLMLLTAAVVVPVQIFTAIVLLSAQPDHFEPSVTGTPTPVYTSGDDAARLGATFFVVIVTVISTIFVVAACTRVVADAYVDHDESIGD